MSQRLLLLASPTGGSSPTVRVHPDDLSVHHVGTGAPVVLDLGRGKSTLVIVLSSIQQPRGTIGVPQWMADVTNVTTQAMAGIKIVTDSLKRAQRVELQIVENKDWKILTAVLARPQLTAALRRQLLRATVFEGGVVGIRLGGRTIPFAVSRISLPDGGHGAADGAPKDAVCHIGDDTEITVAPWMVPEPLDGWFSAPAVSTHLASVRSFFSESFEASSALEALGMHAPLGLLVSGAPGSGKKSLIHQFIQNNGFRYVLLSALEVVNAEAEGSKKGSFLGGVTVKEVVAHCLGAPSVGQGRNLIILTDLDCFARLSAEVAEPAIKSLSQALSMIPCSSNLRFAGITQDAVRLPQRLRKLFHREIFLPFPEKPQREDLLWTRLSALHLATLSTTTNSCGPPGTKERSQLREEYARQLSELTSGFSPLDLVKLCQSAVMSSLKGQPALDSVPVVTMDDFLCSLRWQRPLQMADSAVTVRQHSESWDDFAGYEHVQEKLLQLIEWPLSHPDVFKTLGITPPSGVLLYGPSGCGKSALMRIMASQSKINSMTLKGSEVFSKYVGESEEYLRDFFAKARKNAPCLLLFDEIDSIASKRDFESDGTGVDERVLSTLLNELDGISAKGALFIVGSSNRPDKIDPAMLRPGRLDQHLHVRLPSEQDRLKIIQRLASAVPLDGRPLDFDHLAASTEGLTGADLETAFRQAGIKTLRGNIDAPAVSREILQATLLACRPNQRNREFVAICDAFERSHNGT